jgi:hypothetical protein
MEKRYQGVIRRCKSMKEGQSEIKRKAKNITLLITPWYLLSIALSVRH